MANVHGKVDLDVFSSLYPDAGPDQLQALSVRKNALFCEEVARQGMPIVAGLAEALALAKSRGVRCIAVSNAPRGACEAVLAQLSASIPEADVIEGLVLGAECKRAKPSPDPYVEGMRALGVAPECCVVFEDSKSGARAGVAAEVAAVIGVRTSLGDEALRAVGCAATVEDWRGVSMEMLGDVMSARRSG